MAIGGPAHLQGIAEDSSLRHVVDAILVRWPDHQKYLTASFEVRDRSVIALAEEVAEMIERLSGDHLDALCDGYRWMCNMVLEEDLFFRRNGRYRLSTFAEADQAVYSNASIMDKYMKGLLLSQVLWSNHAIILDFFVKDFLQHAPRGGKLLEVGPGHGLLLALAGRYGGCSELAAWDVSKVSLEHTAACLKLLEVTVPTHLEIHDLFGVATARNRFDSIILSEVCEHLEQPLSALRALKEVLVSGGRIFVNMPINAPATDHIFLLRTPEEVVDMVREAGFSVERTCFAPAAGYSEADARNRKLPISVGVVGVAP